MQPLHLQADGTFAIMDSLSLLEHGWRGWVWQRLVWRCFGAEWRVGGLGLGWMGELEIWRILEVGEFASVIAGGADWGEDSGQPATHSLLDSSHSLWY